jgi:hypothetical protein
MTHHEKSLLDRVKGALGMGGDHDADSDHDEPRGHQIQTERPPSDVESEANGPIERD